MTKEMKTMLRGFLVQILTEYCFFLFRELCHVPWSRVFPA